MGKEKNFENKVKKYLESIGCYPFGTPKDKMTKPIIGYYEKRWGGGTFTKSGLPDMHIVIKGYSFEAELKAPDGKPTELQLKNLDLINQSRSLGFILVENQLTASKLRDWVDEKYPQYCILILTFEGFKHVVRGRSLL